MKAKFTFGLAVLGFAGLTTLSHAAPAQPAAQGAAAPLTRAEVQADAALWRRAGLDLLSQLESYDPQSADVQRRLALYQQWRGGPEFRAELARLQGTTSEARAASATSAN
ncbi:DUF4148 domain-containing protein [Aquincola sp. MAHUQ-54]|uniref:DUF4148 domain-containing protein n=1 Tax=Aquincola agrisoli TaxID=3119538 RepID=A0AAW9QGA4_9BURK